MPDSMSYKLNLSDLKRDGDVSITQQLVDRFSAAIEGGDLEPGSKLPPTRELAAEPRASTASSPSSAT
jgi:DNA-binding transcriptional regulator YhcF (GntR family)